MKRNLILTQGEGIQFYVSNGSEYAIDEIEGKPFYEYAFTPYAVFRSRIFQQCVEELKIGTNETLALQFERKELRIKLLQKIHAGHEPDENSFIMFGLRTPSSATIFNTNTLFWRMASDAIESDMGKSSWKDFPSLFEKVFYLGREEAWRFAWTLVRSAYTDNWPYVDVLLDFARMIPATNGKKRDQAKTAFTNALAGYVSWLKTEVVI